MLTAPSVFGRLHVAPAMSAFLEKYPTVRGELRLGDGTANLVEEWIDAAVRIGIPDDSSYVARPVGATRRVVVASPGYLGRSKKLRTLDDLTHHRAIQFTALVPGGQWRFFHAGGDVSVTLPAHYVTNSADAALAEAERGGGSPWCSRTKPARRSAPGGWSSSCWSWSRRRGPFRSYSRRRASFRRKCAPSSSSYARRATGLRWISPLSARLRPSERERAEL